METYSISEAAEATNLTKKAMRNRVDRGQLRCVLRDGVRRIPRSELERAGLTVTRDRGSPEAAERQEAAPGQDAPPDALGEVLDRLERQAAELAELRVLTREADTLREERAQLEAAVHESRAKATELEAKLEAERQEAEARLGKLARASWFERRRLLRELRTA